MSWFRNDGNQKRSRRILQTVLWGWALAVVVAGCGDSGEAPKEGVNDGTVVIDGSSTVFRISKNAQEGFNATNPEVNVIVNKHGTGGGFGRYLDGDVDIVDASRDAKPDEAAKAKAQGIEWTRFNVGYDGITVVVNPKNDFVKSLTVEQLKKIWEPDSKVTTWKDVDSSWPDRKIVHYCPDADSGTFEFFTEAIVGKSKSQRKDVQASSDDNILVNGVAGDTDGIGYFGYAYFAANKDKLRAIPLQNGPDAKPVEANPATILDKSYTPLSRPLYIFVKNSSARQPATSVFLKYYLTNVETLSKGADYVPPTAVDIAANAKALETVTAGSTVSAKTEAH